MRRKLSRKILPIFGLRPPIGHRPWAIGNCLAGFTLTETVVASTLLIIAVVPILKALTIAHLSTGIIEHKTRSLTLAQTKLDDIKARSIYHYADDFEENNSSLDGLYLCNVDDASTSTNLRMITVSVGYDLNGDNVLASDEILVTLKTLLARRW